MTGVLAQLAAIARGEALPGAARPDLPPRFSLGRHDDGPDEARPEVGRPSASPAVRADPAARRPVADMPPPAAVASTPAGQDLPVFPPPLRPAEPSRSAASDGVPEPPLLERRPTALREKAVVTVRPQAPAAGPATIAAAAPAEAPPPILPRHAPSPAVATPLDEAAVAARHQPARAPDPPLTIVIDRIDVRVPAVAATIPPARRERPRPARTLEDYLAAGKPS